MERCWFLLRQAHYPPPTTEYLEDGRKYQPGKYSYNTAEQQYSMECNEWWCSVRKQRECKAKLSRLWSGLLNLYTAERGWSPLISVVTARPYTPARLQQKLGNQPSPPRPPARFWWLDSHEQLYDMDCIGVIGIRMSINNSNIWRWTGVYFKRVSYQGKNTLHTWFNWAGKYTTKFSLSTLYRVTISPYSYNNNLS